ncbi:MAG: hypothetical protein LBI44_04465 [Oscillospiraceae bacterium]|jgi:hypothetical protein|nr:hypothetical protein [Oscillospiraceae bacterium]
MMQKKAVLGATVFLLVMLVLVGFFSLAAEIGGKDDPLVSLGYLKALEPELMTKIDDMVRTRVESYDSELDGKIAQAIERIEQISGGGNPGGGSLTEDKAFISAVAAEVAQLIGAPGQSGGDIPVTYQRVQVPKDKVILFGEGTSFFKRTGTAAVYKKEMPNEAGLINLSTGRMLDSGNVENNYLYSVTFDKTRGFKASSDVWVFVLGPYVIE